MTEIVCNSTSSVGVVWPPAPCSNERVRGFSDTVVSTPRQADAFAFEVEDLVEQVADGAFGDVTRVSIRAVASVRAIQRLDAAGLRLEGALPIAGDNDNMVVYIGRNSEGRSVDEGTVRHHSSVIHSLAQGSHRPAHKKSEGEHYRMIDGSLSDATKRSLVPLFTDLYAGFGYNEDDVSELLLNPDNTIAYIEDGQGVVSTAMAERGSVSVKGYGKIVLAEITEAATRQGMGGRGYYRRVSAHLVDVLRHSSDRIDIVYGESNLAMGGVLVAAHNNGRRFSHMDATHLGVNGDSFGFLLQNFKVSDGVEQRPYNDFALSYVVL